MTMLQAYYLRRELRGFEVLRTLRALATMIVAAVAFGLAAYGTWWMLDQALGRSLPAQLLSVGAALAAGFSIYGGLVLVAGVPEAAYLGRIVGSKLGRP
jgi:putative peptidoglycan lipid II flippase